jgi:hypothetical protein
VTVLDKFCTLLFFMSRKTKIEDTESEWFEQQSQHLRLLIDSACLFIIIPGYDIGHIIVIGIIYKAHHDNIMSYRLAVMLYYITTNRALRNLTALW